MPADSVDETLFAGLRTLHPDMPAAEKGFWAGIEWLRDRYPNIDFDGPPRLSARSPPAAAKGCLKGALVGGVAGHYAGHHAVLGAVGGCIVGRHLANEKAKEDAAAAAQQMGAYRLQRRLRWRRRRDYGSRERIARLALVEPGVGSSARGFRRGRKAFPSGSAGQTNSSKRPSVGFGTGSTCDRASPGREEGNVT